MNLQIQVICRTCRDTMVLDGTNDQGSTFTCPRCLASVVVRLEKPEEH